MMMAVMLLLLVMMAVAGEVGSDKDGGSDKDQAMNKMVVILRPPVASCH